MINVEMTDAELEFILIYEFQNMQNEKIDKDSFSKYRRLVMNQVREQSRRNRERRVIEEKVRQGHLNLVEDTEGKKYDA